MIGNLLAVPREERGPLRDWSLAILGALEPVLTPEQRAAGQPRRHRVPRLSARLVADRRRSPGDPERGRADAPDPGRGDGERLTEPELLQNCIFILNAGHETTTNLIGNGLFALLEWPEERATADRATRS